LTLAACGAMKLEAFASRSFAICLDDEKNGGGRALGARSKRSPGGVDERGRQDKGGWASLAL